MENDPAFWRREPRPELHGLVSGFFGYDERGQAMDNLIEPAGLDIPLIINFGTAFEIGLGRRPTASDRIGSFAAGLFAGPIVMNSDGLAQCIQVNFTPIGGRLFFGVPLRELAEKMIQLDDLSDSGIDRLARRLAETNSWRTRLDLTQAYVTTRLQHASTMDPQLVWSYRQIERHSGNVRIRDIQTDLGWSRRRLADRFQWEFGLGPKAVARIVRFAAAERMALAQAKPDWADIAAACGFADQAHLTREFASLAGQTPGAFRAAA